MQVQIQKAKAHTRGSESFTGWGALVTDIRAEGRRGSVEWDSLRSTTGEMALDVKRRVQWGVPAAACPPFWHAPSYLPPRPTTWQTGQEPQRQCLMGPACRGGPMNEAWL